jgi:hypothetical protein
MASTSLTRTVSSTGSLTTGTLSMWFKRTTIDAEQYLFENYETSGNRIMIRLLSSNQINLEVKQGNATKCQMNTSGMFRDPNAWYHVVFAMDSSQATASNRLKVYINGVLQTSFTDITYPSSQNQNMSFNEGNPTYVTIGRQYGASNYFDGLMSHVHWIDGTQYAASDFGETDSTTGQWKIKTSPSVTYGTNGFFILKDGNSVTDQSGQSNNLTAATGTLTNTEDCPSNVFATLNPLHKTGGTALNALANGNLTYTGHSGTSYSGTYSTLAASSGKYYAEFKCTGGGGAGDMMIGAGNGITNTTAPGASSNDLVVFGYDGKYYNGGSGVSWGGSSWTSGDIIGVAMDLDNNKLYVSKNGTYMNSGNPTSGSSGTGALTLATSTTGVYHFLLGDYGGDGTPICESNFGNGFFGTTAISSEGTNASGIGKFEYDVPAGYTALSTKGLNE